MQTFLPEYSFTASAKALDVKRLGKQRVECLQLLGAMVRGPTTIKSKNGIERTVKTPWFHHPACQMWRGWEFCLVRYGQIICTEWKSRGYNDTCYEKITALLPKFNVPQDLELLLFTHSSVLSELDRELNEHEKMDGVVHPYWYTRDLVESHRSNLIRKNSEIYKPKWPDTVEGLEYVWPKFSAS